MRKSKIDRCCCTCGKNKRIKDNTGQVDCICEVDGHRINYGQSFGRFCTRYVLDKAYEPSGKWHNMEDFT